MGRPRTPTAMLKLTGAIDHDKKRYADRANEPRPKGTPQKPLDMTPEASDWWDRNVPLYVEMGVATDVDGPALEMAAHWWSESQRLRATGESDYRTLCMLSMASKQFMAIVSKFGGTPSDRAKLSVTKPDEDDPLAEFLR